MRRYSQTLEVFIVKKEMNNWERRRYCAHEVASTVTKRYAIMNCNDLCSESCKKKT
jgi:hypothetical protein